MKGLERETETQLPSYASSFDSSWYKSIDELTFADDFMFGKIMESKEICKQMIEFLLDVKIEKLEFPRLQAVLNPCYNAKSIRLDVYAADSSRVFDIEIQIARKEDLPLRMRYYQSLMDTDFLLKGNNYADMKESYIVFICLFDPIGKNLPVYTVGQKFAENDEKYDDKTHKILYNASAFNDCENESVKAFLRYIKTHETCDSFTEMLERRVREIRKTEKNRKDYMTYQMRLMDCAREAHKEGMDLGLKTGIAQGVSQGEHNARIETARALFACGDMPEKIAQVTGLSLAEVQTLANCQLEKEK